MIKIRFLLKNFILILIFTIGFIFVSCKDENFVQIPGKTESESIVLAVKIHNTGRTAVPEIPENIEYKLKAVKDSKIFETSTPDDDGYYMMTLDQNGEWMVEVAGFVDGKKVVEGSNSVNVRGNGKYFASVNIYYIADDKIGNGSVDLELDVSETSVSYVVVSDASELNGTYKTENGIIKLSSDSVKPGNYNVLFAFYDSNDALLVRFRDEISVKSNVVTKNWVSAKANRYLIEDEETGKTNFVLTPKIITDIANSQFYVKGTGGQLTAEGNDSGSGNYTSPFATIQNAVKRVFALNDLSSENNIYTIYIDGFIDNHEKTIEINSNNYTNPIILSIVGNSSDAKISSDFDIKETELLMKNIEIEGSVISENCELYLENTQISENLQISQYPIWLSGSASIGGILKFNSENQYIKAKNLSQEKVALIAFADDVIKKYERGSLIIDGFESILTVEDIRKFDIENEDYILTFIEATDEKSARGILQYSEGEISDLPFGTVKFEIDNEKFTIDDRTGSIKFTVTVGISDLPEIYSAEITNIEVKLFAGASEKEGKTENFKKLTEQNKWQADFSAENIIAGIYTVQIQAESYGIIYSDSKIIRVEELMQ